MSSPAIVLDLPYREEGQLFTQMKGSSICVVILIKIISVVL